MKKECPVCLTNNNIKATACEVCGFSELANVIINEEEGNFWLATVVIPYRKEWEFKKREAELLTQLAMSQKSEKELKRKLDQERTKNRKKKELDKQDELIEIHNENLSVSKDCLDNDLIEQGYKFDNDDWHISQLGIVYQKYVNNDKVVIKFTNGNIYKGDYIDKEITGRGKFIYKSGIVYEGDFVKGKRNGKGKITWNDGEIYEGDFTNNKRTGKGKYISATGYIIYEGDFIDGRWRA